MRKITSYLIVLNLFMSVSCQDNDNGTDLPTEEKVIELSVESMEMVGSDNEFGIDIFKRILNAESGKNVMISPLSISQALLMTYNGADGDTKKAFEDALYLGDLTIDQVNQAQKDLVKELLEVDPGVIIDIANSIWLKENFNVNPEFISVNQDYYDAEVKQLVFDDEAVNQINDWVNNKTHGKIDEIVESIDPMAIMFLINAVYYYGNWKHRFDVSNTVDGAFCLKEKSEITVPFMNQTTTARLMNHDCFKILELPYGRGNFSMLILLPDDNKSISDILDILDNESYNHWLDKLEETTVDISIPKFKFAYEKNLNYMLKAMNLMIAFDPEHADFSKISDEIQLYINRVKHKSFIDVNEKGTEAAAVTSVEMWVTSVGPSNSKFIANRPFLFVIKEKYTNAILFMGKVEDPSKE